MQRCHFRIGELAEKLGVKKCVIRFWEKEFGIKTTRSQGQQRRYTLGELARFQKIQELLYEKKFTIAGAKKLITDGKTPRSITGACKTTMGNKVLDKNQKKFIKHCVVMRNRLLKLRELL